MPILVTETTPIAISGISSSMGVAKSGGQNPWNPIWFHK